MTDAQRLYIEKLEEYIKWITKWYVPEPLHRNIKKYNKEIASLKQQVEQEEKTVYDENYLNECIRKATPRLSKIKDVEKIKNVDKALDEIIVKIQSIIKPK